MDARAIAAPHPFVYRGFIEYDNSGYYTRLGAADFLLCRTKLTHSTFFLDPPIFPRRNTVNIWPIVIPYSACYACNLSSDDVFVEYGIVIARPRTFFINIESRIFVPTFFFFLSLSFLDLSIFQEIVVNIYIYFVVFR